MARNTERRERTKQALKEANLDALICSLPTNILLLSGYWPVVGTALAIATREGAIAVIVPEDEKGLAEKGWADTVRTFKPGSLEEITNAFDAIRIPLAGSAGNLGIMGGRLGYEGGPMFEPASYAAMHLYGACLLELLKVSIPSALPIAADEIIARLRSVKTAYEVNCIRKACSIAERAFLNGAARLCAGLKETEASARFRAPLGAVGVGYEGTGRADGFVFCMSGANSAEAYGAYARSRARQLASGDFALVHCNSYADGYWTDITRTYSIGKPDAQKRKMYEAVLAAREAALAVIAPGVKAADVDRAARRVLESYGFGDQFKHSTGHGVGFAAINHNARPRLHPKSDDVLETGMVFNVEPAIYIEGYGGLRHCDVVALHASGAEVLTPFQLGVEQLTVAQTAIGG